MKKIYSKPEIAFESFSLSENIAGDCEAKTNLQVRDACGMNFSGLKVFFGGMNGCSDIAIEKVGGDGAWNTICYHVHTGGDNLFNS